MNYKKKVLKNGLRIITIPLKENPAVTVLVMVETGSKYETKEISGISHFLEHMCFKGTRKRPRAIDISRELDSIGSHYNAFTSQEFTGYYAKSDPKHFDTILDVVSDMYQNPVFDEKEIEKEKGVIVEEINMYEDMPQQHIHDVFMEMLYGDQPAGWNVAGNKESVKSLTRAVFEDYRRKHYVSSATTVVVSGKYDEETIIENIEKKFSGIHEGAKHSKITTREAQTKPSVCIKHKETDQTHIVMGVRTYDAYSEHNPALKLLGVILGGGLSSRLFQKLRDEMGVAYYVNAHNDAYTDHGCFAVSAGVDSTRVTEVVEAILSEFRKIKEDGVPEDEIKKAKDYIVGNMLLGLETSDALAEFYGYQEILRKDLKTPAEIAQEVNAVTGGEIKKVAADIFRDAGLNMALLGKYKNNEALKRIFHI